MHIPKILLITLTAPGSDNVAEIVLEDLCRLFPDDKLSIFTVAPKPVKRIPRWPHAAALSPNETSWRPLPGRLGTVCSYFYFRCNFMRKLNSIIQQAVSFGRSQKIEMVWVTLNSVALIGLGAEVAKQLGVPLVSLVWDPPDWMAREQGLDRFSRRFLEKRFGAALEKSERVAVVSEEMAKRYTRRYQANCVILRHAIEGVQENKMDAGHAENNGKKPLRIGFAGTLYDLNQFNQLLCALNAMNWSIDDRPVVIRMIGNWFRLKGIDFPCNIELKGWQRSTQETSRLLSECDINYLPIPFADAWRDFAELSFPTKLSTYLSTGRPVFVHAPAYSSSIKYCEEAGIGVNCVFADPERIADLLKNFLLDRCAYQQAERNVIRILENHFSPQVMRKQFAAFLGVEETELISF